MWTPGPLEIVVLLVIILVIFGPKRVPDLARSLGRGMREFKDSVSGKNNDELPKGSADSSEASEAGKPRS